jgi:hypothetical protein
MADLADFQLTEVEYRRWTRIRDALDLVASAMSVHEAAQAITERLRAGLLVASAESVVWDRDPKDRMDLIKIPAAYWRAEWVGNPRSAFWRSGQVTFSSRGGMPSDAERKATCFGLRVDPGGLANLAPSPAQATTLRPHPGGRPAWGGWDDLWAEIGAQLYLGNLKPGKQREIEVAMISIAERTADGPKIAVIRTRARKLWKAIRG